MSAPRKYDQEFRERAVRMYRERLAEPGESKRGARRHVGLLLDVNPETLRNWADERDRVESGRSPAPRSAESEEVRALRRRVAELERANEILKTSAAFFRPRGARPPTQVIVDYIDSHRESFGVEPVCVEPVCVVLAEAGIAIAPSTYYARSKAPLTDAELADAYLANQLRSLWQDNWGVYGARKLWHAARRAGHQLGRDQVARLMKIVGITGTIRGKHRTVTTRRDDAAPRHPDLVKRGWHAPTGIDQLWVADFSYVWTLAGFVYVAFVVDVFSRRILGWRVTTTKHTSMVTDALRQALQVRRRGEHDWVAAGLIHRSDAGSQYVSVAFTAELITAGIAGSIGTIGDSLLTG